MEDIIWFFKHIVANVMLGLLGIVMLIAIFFEIKPFLFPNDKNWTPDDEDEESED